MADLNPSPDGWDYSARLTEIRARVHAAEAAAGRSGAGVRILAATKTFDAAAVSAACAAGVSLVGENRMQELSAKGAAMRAAGAQIHVIGPLQRNKAKIAVEWADCVQTVDSLELAQRLSRLCVDAGRDLEVMVQVNVSGEETKHGIDPDDAGEFAAAVGALERIAVSGFMTIGLNSTHETDVRAGYQQLREIRDRVLIAAERGENVQLRSAWELSMGMSRDLEWAIAEGATIVRVGSALMGERPQH